MSNLELEKAEIASEAGVSDINPELLFLTLQQFPSGVILSIGGVVSARSVKLLTNEDRDPDIRDSWWTELREEIKSHARALGCPHVLGYTETCAIQEDLFLLSATGVSPSSSCWLD